MEDYLTSYRVFFEKFAASVDPHDQLPVNVAGYDIRETEVPGEILYWTTQYLSEKECPLSLMIPLQRIVLEEVRIESKKRPNDYGFQTDESVYIPIRLMLAVTAKVNEVCLRYLDNSRLDSLPPPPSGKLIKTSSAATKNIRRSMEDRHVEIGHLEDLFGIQTTEPTSFYAVYDGHAGSAAASYCAAHLHQYLVESPHYSTDLNRALIDAYVRTDDEFVKISEEQRVHGGSTAVTICIRNRTLIAAWAGDSQALLARRMQLMQLVQPHKPGREDERERIDANGGKVLFWGTWRVNGQLAVSRAIGDAQYKPYVTAKPEVITVDLNGDEDFVVIACDGLWDFVSEDVVALAVYSQIAADPDDLKAVTKKLLVLAKKRGSSDNISVIVVFLKEPRLIAADNCPPMELGLDNPLTNPPPFVMEEACKSPLDVSNGADNMVVDAAADNGINNSDSDSEDLGPETAVDVDDLDADSQQEPAAPTPPAHAVVEGDVDGALVDNVGESGEDSDDEWNYYKGEGERDGDAQVAAQHNDEPPRSETPGQDNSAWESSSVDMNSSPLNPDAPVFVPCTTGGSEVLLAESPFKPLPMDETEQPDMDKFVTEAQARPNELKDLDNCDQLNGHHNSSFTEITTEHLNGNEKSVADILVSDISDGLAAEKAKEINLIEDLERIQKDTTDFCNIQVFQTSTEVDPLSTDIDEELFERLKNKERDPMSMSFYQEKDDDTCERLGGYEPPLDLNAVHPLPDTLDEDDNTNGFTDDIDYDKENVDTQSVLVNTEQTFAEPNNDIIKFEDKPLLANNAINLSQVDNINEYNASGAVDAQGFSNIDFECTNLPQEVIQTDTPESHKLLFEQIPEIPDGKTSELGFTGEYTEDDDDKEVRPFSSQDESSQDCEMESKTEELPAEPEFEQILTQEVNNPVTEKLEDLLPVQTETPEPVEQPQEKEEIPEVKHDNIMDDLLNGDSGFNNVEDVITENKSEFIVNEKQSNGDACDMLMNALEPRVMDTRTDDMLIPEVVTDTKAVSTSPLPADVPLPPESPQPDDVQEPIQSPVPPVVSESPQPTLSPLPVQEPEIPEIRESEPSPSPTPVHIEKPAESPLPPVHNEVESVVDIQKEIVMNNAEIISQLNENLIDMSPAFTQSGPAPDIVPEQPLAEEKYTPEPIVDDICMVESRAQEICMPVSNEIPTEVLTTATPPPTPSATTLDTPTAPPLSDLPPDTAANDLIIPAAAAITAAAAATAAAVATSAKTTKKPSTPKPSTPASKNVPKTTATPKTPVSGIKKTTVTASKLSTPASKPSTPATKPSTPKLVAAKSPAAAKPPATKAPVAARPLTKPAVPKTVAAPKPATAKTTTAAPKPAAAKPAMTRPAAAVRAPPSTTAPKPALARVSSAAKASTTAAPKAPAAPRPAPRTTRPVPAPPKPAVPKLAEKKPLSNGDVKAPLKKVTSTTTAARPAPRPTPRATSATTTTAAKSAAAPRAPIQKAARPALDKQSKDLVNKRITSSTRTATTKTSLSSKSAPSKPAPIKKPVPAQTELTNGDVKAPPSPTPDNALLPDVIA